MSLGWKWSVRGPAPGAALYAPALLSGRLGIKGVDVDQVAAEVVDVGEAIVGREGCEVRVSGFLAVGIGTVDGVVLAPHERAEFAIGDFEAGCAAPAVVGREEHTAVRSMAQWHVPLLAEFCGREPLQLSVVNAEAGDFAGGFAVEAVDLAGGKEVFAIGREAEPVDRRRFPPRRQAGEFAVRGIPVERADPFRRAGGDEDALLTDAAKRLVAVKREAATVAAEADIRKSRRLRNFSWHRRFSPMARDQRHFW